jgi:hypothetical protein
MGTGSRGVAGRDGLHPGRPGESQCGGPEHGFVLRSGEQAMDQGNGLVPRLLDDIRDERSGRREVRRRAEQRRAEQAEEQVVLLGRFAGLHAWRQRAAGKVHSVALVTKTRICCNLIKVALGGMQRG